jgi:CubicO group peptidase (beta-lactamase class C family)
VFISNRLQADVEALDLNFSFIKYTKNTIDFQDSSVTSYFLWGKSKAIYRKGFGAVIVRKTDEQMLRSQKYPIRHSANFDPDTTVWPLGNIVPDSVTGINKTQLTEIAKKMMDDKAYGGNPFAFMVVHKGIPAIESYSEGFNAKTRFLSWSMAKSFTNALAGIMVQEGKLDINKPAEINEWQADDRKNITINDLMQMQSGLKWNEDYGSRSDVNVMLHCEDDMAKFAYNQPFESAVGSKWYYSSGSTNVVNYLLRKKLGNDQEYYNFAQTRLFSKIGMPGAVFETDASGTQVGSSYIFATARDYARFGLLYLQDGIFNGERILPEGWVKYCTTPALASNSEYGSFFWLNQSGKLPSVPPDTYWAQGHNGQRIFIVPSKKLVVVVTSYSPKPDKVIDFDWLLGDILKALE